MCVSWAPTAVAKRSRELGVESAVSFEGAAARDDLPAVYRSASVCVVPSRFDNFPYTCLEATMVELYADAVAARR